MARALLVPSITPARPADTPALTTAYRLSMLLVPLVVTASAAGLIVPDLYRDNAWARAGWQGQDVVTLAVAVPLLALSIRWAMQGSLRGRLLWLGANGYMLYSYLYYAFAAAFNPLFLVYVAILPLSLFALVLGMLTLPHARVEQAAQAVPLRPVRALLLITAGALMVMWLGMAVPASITGDVPQTVIDSGHPTAVVFVLDLGVLVPCLVASAYGLHRRRSWGYAGAAIMLVKCATYGAALLGMTIFMWRAEVLTDPYLVPLWVLVTVAGTVLSSRYFAAIRPLAGE